MVEDDVIEETTDKDFDFSDCSSIQSESIHITKPTLKSEKEYPDKYIELLFDVIGNDKQNITWDIWFQIAGVLKSSNYD